MDKERYRILSSIFHMPDTEFIGYLRSAFLEDAHVLPGDVHEGFREFVDEHSEKDDEQFYRMLAVEYTRLFVNGMHGVQCPPYESMYRENVIVGECTIAVLRKYKEAGLEVLANFHGLPDHIAVELEFLHYLAAREDRLRHDAFLREHVSQWAHPFSRAIDRNATLDFYKHAGAALAMTVAEALGELAQIKPSVVQV